MIEDIHQDPAEDNAQETSTSESAPVSASEPSSEQKREIARWVADGMGLSDLQKKIDSVHQDDHKNLSKMMKVMNEEIKIQEKMIAQKHLQKNS